MRACLFILLAGCGRIAFDPIGDGGGGNGSGSGSGDSGTGGGSDALTLCPMVPSCPDQQGAIGTTMTTFNPTNMTNHGMSSQLCGSGSGNPEMAILLTPSVSATYTFTVSPSLATLYVQDQCCGGTELKCGASGMTFQRNAGDRMVLVIEGASGGQYMVTVTGS